VHADPTGLPPTLIQVSGEEVLLSDSLSFAGRAAMAGGGRATACLAGNAA